MSILCFHLEEKEEEEEKFSNHTPDNSLGSNQNLVIFLAGEINDKIV